jgi:hypothetical protein
VALVDHDDVVVLGVAKLLDPYQDRVEQVRTGWWLPAAIPTKRLAVPGLRPERHTRTVGTSGCASGASREEIGFSSTRHGCRVPTPNPTKTAGPAARVDLSANRRATPLLRRILNVGPDPDAPQCASAGRNGCCSRCNKAHFNPSLSDISAITSEIRCFVPQGYLAEWSITMSRLRFRQTEAGALVGGIR